MAGRGLFRHPPHPQRTVNQKLKPPDGPFEGGFTADAVIVVYTPPPVSVYQQTVVDTPGLLGYWPLSEPSGTAAYDYSGNGHHGTYTGTFTLGQPGLLSAGDESSVTSVNLDPTTNGRVVIPDHADFDFANGPWTVEAWLSLDTLAVDPGRTILSKGTGGMLVRITGNPTADIQVVRSHQSFVNNGGPDFSTSTTYHVVVAYSGSNGTLDFYVDGALDVSKPATGADFVNNALDLIIGRDHDEAPFDGEMQHVAYYGVALDAATVLEHYEAAFDPVSTEYLPPSNQNIRANGTWRPRPRIAPQTQRRLHPLQLPGVTSGSFTADAIVKDVRFYATPIVNVVINEDSVADNGNFPGTPSGSGKHVLGGNDQTSSSFAVTPGYALDLAVWDDAGEANGAFGDGSTSSVALWTGPTSDKVGGTQLFERHGSGYFGSGHYTGTAQSYAWLRFNESAGTGLWYREVHLTETQAVDGAGITANACITSPPTQVPVRSNITALGVWRPLKRGKPQVVPGTNPLFITLPETIASSFTADAVIKRTITSTAAFPSVISETGGNDVNNFTTRDISLPACNEGDLLIVAVGNDASATQSWVHDQGFTDWIDSAGTSRLVIKYLVVGPVLDSVLTVNTSGGAEQASWSILRIAAGSYFLPASGALDFLAPISQSTASPDPGSLTSSWSSTDTLWLTLLFEDNSTAIYNSTPSGYTMGTRRFLNNNQAVGVQWGWRTSHAQSEDPGAWSLNAVKDVQVLTAAVRPSEYGTPPYADAVILRTQSATFTADADISSRVLTPKSNITALGVFRTLKRVAPQLQRKAIPLEVGEFIGGFTADAVIKREQSASFTADAIILRTMSPAFGGGFGGGFWSLPTADAVILRTQSATFTADAVVFKTISGSFTADAEIFREGQVGKRVLVVQWRRAPHPTRQRKLHPSQLPGETSATFTADADISARVLTPKRHVTALGIWRAAKRIAPQRRRITVLQPAEQTASFTADAVIRREFTGSLTADAIVRREGSASFTADAVVLRAISGSFTADAVIKREIAGSFAADAVILRMQVGSFTADAVVAITTAGSFTADAVIKREQSGSFTADSIIRREATGSFTADADITAPVWSRKPNITALGVWRPLKRHAPQTKQRSILETLAQPQFNRFRWDIYRAGWRPAKRIAPQRWLSKMPPAQEFSASFTADAIVLRTIEGSFTADASIRTATSGAGTMDAVILRSQSGTFTADAEIVGPLLAKRRAVTRPSPRHPPMAQRQLHPTQFFVEQGGSYTADAIVRVERTGSFSADAVVRWTTSATATADAVVLRQQISSLTTDAIVLRTQTGSCTADAVIKREISGSATADAVIARTMVGSLTADAVVFRTQTATLVADAVIQRNQTGTFVADAVIRREIAGSYTVDAVILKTQTGAFTADAVVFRTITGTYTVDAVVMPRFAIDAVILRTQSGSATADAVIMPRFTADAVLLVTQTGSFSADAFVAGVGVFAFSIDAVIEREQAGSAAADAVILRSATGSFTADAVIEREQAGSATADAVLRRTATATFTADAVLLASRSATFTADAVIRVTTSFAATANAVIAKTQISSFTANAVIRASRTGGATADAVLLSHRTGSATADAFISTVPTFVFTADAVLQRTSTFTATANAVLRAASVNVLSADAVLEQTSTNTSTVDAILRRTAAATFTADAEIRFTGGSFTADAVVRGQNQYEFTADAVIAVFHFDPIDATIDAEEWSATIDADELAATLTVGQLAATLTVAESGATLEDGAINARLGVHFSSFTAAAVIV